MKVLIACEESQTVCIEFRKRGFEAFSCDIQECSGEHPEWHYKQDVFEVINMGWDMMIAFPPCTYLTVTGNKWMKDEFKDRFPTRQQDRKDAIQFFTALANADIERIAIENPIGIMSSEYMKPSQIIQPYFFGDNTRKATCLWLKNLPKLVHQKQYDLFSNEITHTQPLLVGYTNKDGVLKTYSGAAAKWFKTKEERQKERSKTFPGIARAMAEQWGKYLIEKNKAA